MFFTESEQMARKGLYETHHGSRGSFDHPIHNNRLRELIGLSPKRLPGPGYEQEAMLVNGIEVWVIPQLGAIGGRGRGGMKHRVKARCPDCGGVFAAGNLNQHMKVHS